MPEESKKVPDPTAILVKFAWVPVPIFLILIILFRLTNSTAQYQSVEYQIFFNLLFSTLTSAIAIILIGRSFLKRGSPGLLLIGCGVMVWGAIGITGAFTKNHDPHLIILIYNCCIGFSALLHFCGALVISSSSRLVRETGKWLTAAYGLSAGVVVLIAYLLMNSYIPMFYIQGQGGLLIRNMILGSSLFVFSAVLLLLMIYHRKHLSPFMRWYILSIALIAVGLFGFLSERVHADPVSWTARVAQYLSGIYMVIAAIALSRDIRFWSISLKAALRETEERYRNTLDNMVEGCAILNYDWTYLYVNEVNARQFRLRKEEMIGRNLFKLFPWMRETSFYPNIKRCLDERMALKFEEKYAFPDGSAAWYEVSVSPVQEGIFVIMMDITERKIAEESLKVSEQRFRSLFENMVEGFAYCRMLYVNGKPDDFIYLGVNQSFESLTGLKDVIGKKVSEVIPGIRDSDPGLFEIYGRVALTGKPERFEIYLAALKMWFFISVYSPLKEHFVAVFDVISERKRTEEALRESEAKYKELVENAHSIIIKLDTEGRITYFNEYAQQFFGFKEEEIIGKSAIDTIVPKVESTGRDMDEMLAGIYEDPNKHAININENIKKNGDLVWIVWYNNALYDKEGNKTGHIAIGTDITEQRKAEQALRESEQRWVTTLASIGDAVIATDIMGKITFMNPVAEALTGWNRRDAIHRPIRSVFNIINEQTRQNAENPVEKVLGSGLIAGRMGNAILICPDGREVPVDHSGAPIKTEDGRITGVVLVFRDITERKVAEEVVRNYSLSLEETVKKRTAELEAAKERAESADRLKSAFLATMSHELRTPLNSIIGFSGIMLQEKAGALNQEQKKQLGIVQNSGRHLLSLINDILDLSRIEAGQLAIDYEYFDFQEVVVNVKEMVEPSAISKGLSFNISGVHEIGEIRSDKQRIKQILLNLVNNAIKFTEAGSISIRCRRNNNFVTIEIADTGIGIKKENIDKLFNPFIRIESDLTRKYEGSGLGLSICRKLLEKLHGEITVNSEYGAGSAFTITFPVE